MQRPESMESARDALHERLARFDAHRVTVGALLDAARTTHQTIPALAEDDVRLVFRCTPHANPCQLDVELVWHWPRPDLLDAPPARMWLCFDASMSEPAKDADVRCHDYPDIDEFLSAAVAAAALDPHARARDIRIECEQTG